jgi:hypothetical protein
MVPEFIMESARNCLSMIRNSSDREEVLENIAAVSEEIKNGYFENSLFDRPDEIIYNFIDLLDQISFELKDNLPAESGLREALFDNLLIKVTIICEGITDPDAYRSSLERREITQEDLPVIRLNDMTDLIPRLLSTFSENPDLQKPIIKTFLRFRISDLINFYYNIASGSYCYEMKLLAIIGLKLYSKNFTRWNSFYGSNTVFNEAVDLIENYNCGDTTFPETENIYFMLYTLFCIELTIDTIPHVYSDRVLNFLYAASLKKNTESHNFLTQTAISSIIMMMNNSQLESIIKNSELIKKFIHLLDTLPYENLSMINERLKFYRSGIIDSVNNLFLAGKLKLNETSSNMVKYFCLNI